MISSSAATRIEELAAGVEVDPLARGQVLDERHDDRGDVDLRGLQLLLEDERQEEVERPLERIEVQLEIANRRRHGANLAGRSDAPLARDGHPPLRLRRPRAAPAAWRWGPVALREDVPRDAHDDPDQRHPGVEPQPGDVVRGIDAQELLAEPPDAVEGDVGGEQPRAGGARSRRSIR